MNPQQISLVVAALSVSQLRDLANLKEQQEQQLANIFNAGQSVSVASAGGPAGQVPTNASSAQPGRRQMSAEARERIAAAQRARWAKINGKRGPKTKAKATGVTKTAGGRNMSAEARERIAAAQRARWAKIKGKGRKARTNATAPAPAPVASAPLPTSPLATA